MRYNCTLAGEEFVSFVSELNRLGVPLADKDALKHFYQRLRVLFNNYRCGAGLPFG